MRTLLLSAFLFASCTPAPVAPPARPGSRGLHADEHLDAARDHERRAADLARWPETRSDGIGIVDDPVSGLWYRRFETTEQHAHVADSHRAAAAQLHASYEAACGTRSADEVALSPLQRHGRGGARLADGVVIFLGPEAGPADQLMAAIRCHRAWMMLSESGMDDCPLDLADVQIVAHGDPTGISVELTTTNQRLIPELQRRAAVELEQAARHQARTP